MPRPQSEDWKNLTIVTANMVTFEGVGDGILDRFAVSVEMFEQYEELPELLPRPPG